MLRFKSVLSLLVLALSFQLPTFVKAQTPTKEGTSTISGQVTLKGEPAAGISVGLQPQQTNPGGGPFVVDRSKYLKVSADNEGRFRFSGLSAGQYRIVALAPGFVSSDDSPLYSGKQLNLTDGENLENIELRLKRGAVITGRITDPSGNPVIEKQVQLMKMDARGNFTRFNFGGIQSINTDDRGVYRIHSLPPGKYKVSFGYSSQDGPQYDISRLYFAKTFHPDTTDEKQAKIIELGDGTEATDIDIKIAESKKAYDISGKVIEAGTGQPIAGIRIAYGTILPDGRISGSVSGMAVTDAQGEYQLQGVLPGKYFVFADSRFDSQATDFYSDQTPVEISNSDMTGIEITAHRGGSVSGVAIVEGTNDPAILKQLSGINLNLGYRSPEASISSSRNIRLTANGSFRFSGVKPGKVDIRAYTSPEGLKQIRVEYNGVPLTDGFEIQAGENLTNVRVIFGYGTGVVRGQLKFVGGIPPLEGVNLLISGKFLSGTGSSFNAPVDARGQFVLKNLIAGEYELRLIAFTSNGTPEMSQLLRLMNKVTQRVMVGSGEMPIEFLVDLSQKENDK